MAKTQLHSYIVSYYMYSNDSPHGLVVVAYSKKEAGDLFIRFMKAKKLYDSVIGVVVTTATKTKENAHFYTLEYYNKQYELIDNLEGVRHV